MADFPPAGEDDFSTLMVAVQKGDRRAYHALLTAITPLIRTQVRRHWRDGSVDQAEDVVQEVLLSLHQVRHTYDPVRPFRPWLGAIIKFRLADAARRGARRSANEVAVEILPETFSGAETNDGSEGLDAADSLKQAMAKLPEGQRQAIDLLKLKGLSLKEASDQSGQTVASLKVATHRAIRKLQTLIRREDHR
jgi:RNA polymerase sigma-70 factor (ECF subfamily)